MRTIKDLKFTFLTFSTVTVRGERRTFPIPPSMFRLNLNGDVREHDGGLLLHGGHVRGGADQQQDDGFVNLHKYK